MDQLIKKMDGRVVKKKGVYMTKSGKKLAKTKDQYTAEEHALIVSHCKLLTKESLKFTTGKDDETVAPKDDLLLTVAKRTEAFGTADLDLQDFLLNQVIVTFKGCQSSKGSCENSKMVEILNTAMAILQGIKPNDEIEGMLALQMIGVHNMAMDAMRLAMISGQYPEAKERNTNQATKLLRTFSAQMEALKKYRTGGQQKMIVEHVHIHEGGASYRWQCNSGGWE